MLLGKLRLPFIACAFAATITFGCGGNGDDNTDSGETGGSTSMTPEATRNDMVTRGSATEPTQPPDDSSTGNGVPANTARVIVGDRTYEFEMLICVSIGGAVGGPGRAVDGSDVSLELDIPPEDWETSSEDWGPPYIRVDDDANELDWRAGGDTPETFPTIDASQSVVESFTTQGGSSQGTAIFADTNAAFDGNFEVATGSFAVNCGN